MAAILIVDDEPRFRKAVQIALHLAGHETRQATSGEEALLAMREHRADVVLLDLNMPGMGGIQTCKAMRRDFEAVAIIVVSLRGLEQDNSAALQSGADLCLTKPFSMEVLLANIETVLHKRSGSAGD
ncbi:MAG: response regulator transcription factor [Bryobacterales bacterium]|nr:response regulator transcription factor [Bryobacterales bacterium]